MASVTVASPFGPLTVTEEAGVVTRLDWRAGADSPTELLRRVADQLAAYFSGEQGGFDLPLAWGEGFDSAVRRAMAAIPCGETRTYGQIAALVGAPAQAVGQACGANPLPILIPCHRVIGTDWFGGYSAPGGVETKAALLRQEGALLL